MYILILVFQLKNLAFGKGGGKSHQQRNAAAGDGGDEKKMWEKWKEHDKEVFLKALSSLSHPVLPSR